MQLGIYEILDRVTNKSTKKEKIEELRRHANNPVFTLLLKMSFDKGLKWMIPEGTPPYKPSVDSDQQGILYKEAKRFYIFLDLPQSANISQLKRENLFINLLETVHPKDAQVIIAVKDKKPLAPGLTKKLVEEAFPNLLQ